MNRINLDADDCRPEALWGAEARVSSYTINESRSICRAINRANRKVAYRSEA